MLAKHRREIPPTTFPPEIDNEAIRGEGRKQAVELDNVLNKSTFKKEDAGNQEEDEGDDPTLKRFDLVVPLGVDKLGMTFIGSEVVKLQPGRWAACSGIEIDDEIETLNGARFLDLTNEERIVRAGKDAMVDNRAFREELYAARRERDAGLEAAREAAALESHVSAHNMDIFRANLQCNDRAMWEQDKEHGRVLEARKQD